MSQLLSDEIYSRLLYEDNEHVSLLGYESLRERTILLDGWSKTYAMTGWRLGYSVWPKALFPLVERLAVNCHSCVNAATQYAGIAALNGPQDAVETMRQAFDTRRRNHRARAQPASGLPLRRSRGRVLHLPQYRGHRHERARAAEPECWRKRASRPWAGTSFGGHGEGFIRFSYAASEEDIERAVERIRTVL